MDILHSNNGLTVVERWLRKLIEANNEHDKKYRIGKYKREEKPPQPRKQKRKPKPKPKVEPNKQKESVVSVVVVKRDRQKEIAEALEARKRYEESKIKGFVYLMRSGNGYHKIGITKNIKQRVNGIRIEFPIEIDVVHYIASNNHRGVEKFLHKKYSSKRVQHEWFNLEPQDIQWIESLNDYDLDGMV
jgi:predicted GIY-YIG superfamily endonuclease